MGIVFDFVDWYEFETGEAITPIVRNLDGRGSNELFISYSKGSDGWAATLRVEDDGTVGETTDSLEWDASAGTYPYPLHVSTAGGYSYFAISYSGPFTNGYIKTIKVDDSGNFDSVVDTLTISADSIDYSVIVQISGDIYAVVYSTLPADNDLWIKTFDMTPEGVIGAVIDTLEFDTGGAAGNEPLDAFYYSGNVFAFYPDSTGAGVIKVIPVTAAGTISAVANTDNYDAVAGEIPCTGSIQDSVFSVIYADGSSNGQLKTFSISGTSITWIDSLEFDSGGSCGPTQFFGTHMTDYYGLAYMSTATQGKIAIVEITNTGVIGGEVATKRLVGAYLLYPRVVRIGTTTIYAVVGRQQAAYFDGYVASYDIHLTPPINKSAWGASQSSRSGVTNEALVASDLGIKELLPGGITEGRTFWLRALWAYNSHATDTGILRLWDQSEGDGLLLNTMGACPLPAGEIIMLEWPEPGLPFITNVCASVSAGTVAAYECGCSGYEVGGG